MRVFLQAIQLQSALIKDLELDDLKERLEALEGMQGGSQDEEEQAYFPEYEEQDDEYTD